MPSAIPDAAAAHLPPARMIDPRGHRFGAGISAIILILATITGTPWLVAVVLLSIGVSAAFGLRYSIYGVAWRRIVAVAGLGKVEPEHEYPPRFAQVLGSVAVDAGACGSCRRRDDHRMGLHAGRRGPADPAGRDRLLPRLPAVLPALVGAGPRHAALDPRPRAAAHLRHGSDPLQLRGHPALRLGRHEATWIFVTWSCGPQAT